MPGCRSSPCSDSRSAACSPARSSPRRSSAGAASDATSWMAIGNRDYFVVQRTILDLRPHLPGGEPARRHPVRRSSTRGSGTPDGGRARRRRDRPPVESRASRGLWGDAIRRLLRNRPALLGVFFIAVFVIAAVFAPFLAPYDPLEGCARRRLKPPIPRAHHGHGRAGPRRATAGCSTARRSASSPASPRSSWACSSAAASARSPAASAARSTSILMRVVDVLLAIPGILLAIGIVAWLDRGLPADHVRGRHRQCADLRPDPARQPARPCANPTT